MIGVLGLSGIAFALWDLLAFGRCETPPAAPSERVRQALGKIERKAVLHYLVWWQEGGVFEHFRAGTPPVELAQVDADVYQRFCDHFENSYASALLMGQTAMQFFYEQQHVWRRSKGANDAILVDASRRIDEGRAERHDRWAGAGDAGPRGRHDQGAARPSRRFRRRAPSGSSSPPVGRLERAVASDGRTPDGTNLRSSSR
ncbi:hypothetical protein [Lentzea sp. E54]|uniref:hypothetical protein n=1 Tax=Lentzea xerophila TaxID=3435883 RepID=UPI003DA5774E